MRKSHDFSSDLTLDAIRKLGTTYQSKDSEQKRRTANAVGAELAEIGVCLFSLLYGSTARGTSISIDIDGFNYDSDIDIACFIDSSSLDPESLLKTYEQIFSIESSMSKVEITVYDVAIVDRVLDDDPLTAILFAHRLDSGKVLHGEDAATAFRRMMKERIEANGSFELYEKLESMYRSYAEAHVADTKFRLLIALSRQDNVALKDIDVFEDDVYAGKWVE